MDAWPERCTKVNGVHMRRPDNRVVEARVQYSCDVYFPQEKGFYIKIENSENTSETNQFQNSEEIQPKKVGSEIIQKRLNNNSERTQLQTQP